MKKDTEGIVLRETKTSYNRRMILLFTKDYGKISAGTSLGERGKTKSALALQHFTFGRYVLHEGRNSYNIDSAEVVRSFYGIGENVDKYFNGSYVLEFTGKVLEENVPMPAVFNLLVDFFEVLEGREKGFGTLVLAYQAKLFRYLGVVPVLDRCAVCGKTVEKPLFSVTDGGVICQDCARDEALIYPINFDIIDAFKYFISNPLKKLENIALNEETGRLMQQITREYAAYHLDASNIKSESMV
ncbi:MAG: DNA repair protein RecO [Bacillota bacterium]|nr:DNA repair protein RecO [Bacillota bacterium]